MIVSWTLTDQKFELFKFSQLLELLNFLQNIMKAYVCK